MKTKEFIEKVKKLGFGIEYYKNPLSNVGLRCDYDLFTIYLEDKDLVEIWTNCRYAISTISDGHSCFINGYDVDKLYKLCFEYANTPVMDREEKEKEFYLKHKWIGNKQNYLIKSKIERKSFTFQSFNNRYEKPTTERAKFTEKEIEELKEKLNTNLEDFEMVEVEDESN